MSKIKSYRTKSLAGRQGIGNPRGQIGVQRASSAATHATTANAYEQSERR